MDYSQKPVKRNPRKGANLLSQLSFLWIVPLMLRGCFHGLNREDLSKCLKKDRSDELGDKLEASWKEELAKARNSNRKPKLRNALFHTFWRSCVVDGCLVLTFALLKAIMPVFLAQLLIQFQLPSVATVDNMEFNETTTNSSSLNEEAFVEIKNISSANDESFSSFLLESGVFVWNDPFSLATILILLTFVSCFVCHQNDLRQRMVGAQMRIACSSAIYRKTLRMSKRATTQTSAGNVVNLLSNDVSRLDYGFIFVHYIWILPIQACLICYLIWREVKYAAVVGVVGLLLKTIPIQTGLSKISSILRMRVAKRGDYRISVMNELIQGIQVIKMYAWEAPFRNVVKTARQKEVDQIQWASYIRGIYLSTMVFTERSTLFIAIIACIYEGRAITADLVFSMAAFFNVLQLTAAIFYPMAVSLGAEALVSVKRIQDFLMLEDQPEAATLGLHQNEIEIIEPERNVIEMINVNASWTNEYHNLTLSNLNIKIKSGKLYAIVGSVGSGKSSILQLLLGELPIYSGDVLINGEASYGSQDAWIFAGTVRHNILFGLPYDKLRYQETIRHCALLTDFQQLPHGDKTQVGERGSALSGGQRARVSLARAVYKNASIYLLDDPLSAVDAHVGKQLFDECIGPSGYLARQKATRILVTHQVHFLKDADWIIVMENGKILRQGPHDSVMDLDLAKHVSSAVSSASNDEDVDEVNMKRQVTNAPTRRSIYVDDDDDDDNIPYIDGVTPISVASSVADVNLLSEENNDEDKLEKRIPFYQVFWKYFHAGANTSILLSFVLFLLFSQLVTSGSDYFVTLWTRQELIQLEGGDPLFTTMEGLYLYGFLIIAVVIVTLSRGFMFFAICMRSSKKLHDQSFLRLLHSPMRFFDTNPCGRILNRFSKDMGAVDELLPKAIIDAAQNLLVMSGILILIALTTPSRMFLIALGFAVMLYGLILKLYLRTAQDLKRLEGITKSPVFSQMGSTLTGISTIRACKASDRLALEFDNLQNVHSSVWQILMSINTALGLWLDCVSCAFVASICYSFILTNQQSEASGTTTTSSNVGLAISQALILTGMVQYGIRQMMESFQLFTNTERVLQYTRLEQEPLILRRPTRDWPFKGLIEFKNMSLFYDVNSSPALKNLNFTIEPAMKVGIVGRTGAGKSSIISALFRLAFMDGRILIDGIDTSDINLESLRSKISIIPQDPVLFSATIRYNLDPFDAYSDAEIWKALEVVELKSAINGLQFMVTEGGSNFSVGQRQLLCLARAILRNNKILLLDEATANIDQNTDALIQKTIRETFAECSVLTIAHRLHTIIDSDMVLVMENGYAKEYDVPYKLLQNSSGIFRDLVNNLGHDEKEKLFEIAKLKYEEIFNREQQPKTIWKFKDV